MIFVFLLIFVFIVISQMGRKLPARHALPWFLATLFLLIAAAYPEAFRPIANFLGITLISNLVMASMILFLFMQLFDLSSDQAKLSRSFRKLVSTQAVNQLFPNFASDLEKSSVRILVTLPCYNEALNIPILVPKLEQLKQKSDARVSFNYCFINDGSKDDTLHVLQTLCPKNHLTHSANVNVAGVLLTGFQLAKQARYDFVVQCDSDGQHPIERIPDLVETAISANADLVLGSRFIRENKTRGDDLEATTASRLLGIVTIRLILMMFGKSASVYDPTSGFRVYSKKAVQYLDEHMPDEYPEPETIALLATQKLNIKEVLVKMSQRTEGVSSLAGLKSVRYMIKVYAALIGLRLRTLIA